MRRSDLHASCMSSNTKGARMGAPSRVGGLWQRGRHKSTFWRPCFAGSVAFEFHERANLDAEVPQALRAADFRQIDDEARATMSAPISAAGDRRRGSAAGGDEVVDQ